MSIPHKLLAFLVVHPTKMQNFDISSCLNDKRDFSLALKIEHVNFLWDYAQDLLHALLNACKSSIGGLTVSANSVSAIM